MTARQPFLLRYRRRIIGVVGSILVLALLAGVGWSFIDPHRGQARVGPTTLPPHQGLQRVDAVADLEFVADLIKARHVWTTQGLPPGFRAVTQTQVQSLPGDPTMVDVWRATQRMLVELGDGHTFSGAVVEDEVAYAVDYRMHGGSLHVRAGDALWPVLRVNGVEASDLVRRNRELTPADNDGWASQQLVDRLTSASGLALLGAAPQGDYVVDHTGAGGEERALSVRPGAVPQQDVPVAEFVIDDDLAVLTIHRCDPDETYRDTLERFFHEVERLGLNGIVVDLRGNPGGNSRVTDLFVGYLDTGAIPSGSATGRYGNWVFPLGSGTMEGRKQDVAFAGEIHVLTDHATFSAAADFAVVLSDNHLARIVGEAPGSAPTGAGDVVVFQLPHSGLYVQVSYKEFQRPDATRSRAELEVDVPADPTGSVREMLAGLR